MIGLYRRYPGSHLIESRKKFTVVLSLYLIGNFAVLHSTPFHPISFSFFIIIIIIIIIIMFFFVSNHLRVDRAGGYYSHCCSIQYRIVAAQMHLVIVTFKVALPGKGKDIT